MKQDTQWSRRSFLQGIGYTSALGVMDKLVPAKKDSGQSPFEAIPTAGFAYVGFDDGDSSGIHVFEIRDAFWKQKQSISSRSPVSLALHPSQQFLYAANEIDTYEGLPRGTVEAYKIDAHGTLTLINRQPLSLSGIRPRHIAVSADGNHLIAAIHGGGAYNVLPILGDGAVERVTQIVKEVGAGPHPVYQASAHPHTVLFNATGQHLLATDEGCDRISVFTFQNGKMTRPRQALARSASRPGHLAVHPSGEFLYVSNASDGSIDCYRWCSEMGSIKHEQRITLHSNTAAAGAPHLVTSLSGRNLYASTGEQISVWEIHALTGQLSSVQQQSFKNRSLGTLTLSHDSRRLVIADSRQHVVLSIPIHTGNGRLGTASTVAKVPALKSLLIRNI